MLDSISIIGGKLAMGDHEKNHFVLSGSVNLDFDGGSRKKANEVFESVSAFVVVKTFL